MSVKAPRERADFMKRRAAGARGLQLSELAVEAEGTELGPASRDAMMYSVMMTATLSRGGL